MNVRDGKERLDQVRQKFLADPSEGQARQGYSELCCRQISIEMRPDIFRKPRPSVPTRPLAWGRWCASVGRASLFLLRLLPGGRLVSSLSSCSPLLVYPSPLSEQKTLNLKESVWFSPPVSLSGCKSLSPPSSE